MIFLSIDRSIGQFGILCYRFVILLRSIGQFGILRRRFVISLLIDRSIYRAIWYSFSSLCDITVDWSVDRSIDQSIGLFSILCRRFVILLAIYRSIGLFGILCRLCFVILLPIGHLIDLSISQSGYLVFFVVAL